MRWWKHRIGRAVDDERRRGDRGERQLRALVTGDEVMVLHGGDGARTRDFPTNEVWQAASSNGHVIGVEHTGIGDELAAGAAGSTERFGAELDAIRLHHPLGHSAAAPHTSCRVNVKCVTPLGEDAASIA
jgi:hypothetical protein